MSATDFRRICELPDGELLTIECSDGRTVQIEHSELGVTYGFDLDVDLLDAFINALIGARLTISNAGT